MNLRRGLLSYFPGEHSRGERFVSQDDSRSWQQNDIGLFGEDEREGLADSDMRLC